MWRGLSLRCKIATFVAVIFFIVAGYCFFLRFRNQAYFRSSARFDCVMAMRVDFSVPSIYSATVMSKPRYIENAFLALDVPERILSKTDPEALLSGLEGTFEIVDKEGKRIYYDSLITDPNSLKSRHFKNFIEFYHFPSWYEFVQWQVNINITHGASRLEGIPHRLVLFDRNYNVSINEDIRTLFGLVNLIIAVIIFIVIIVSMRKKEQLGNDQQKVEVTEE